MPAIGAGRLPSWWGRVTIQQNVIPYGVLNGVSKMSEQKMPDDGPMNSVRGFASGLVEDSRERGYRGYTADQVRELLASRLQAALKLLKSDDLKAINRGLRALATIEKGWLRVLDVETQYAKTGVEAATAFELVRQRLEADQQQDGLSPENVSMVLSQVVRELAASGQDDPDAEDTVLPETSAEHTTG